MMITLKCEQFILLFPKHLRFALIFFPRMVEAKHAETAGTMMAFMLIIGLAMGAGFSFFITWVI